jgi:hypothetical protein
MRIASRGRLSSLHVVSNLNFLSLSSISPLQGRLHWARGVRVDERLSVHRDKDRILQKRPGDLPIPAPTKSELVIAKALGLDVPPGVLALAEESSNKGAALLHLLTAASGTFEKSPHVRYLAAFGGKADISQRLPNNRDL